MSHTQFRSFRKIEKADWLLSPFSSKARSDIGFLLLLFSGTQRGIGCGPASSWHGCTGTRFEFGLIRQANGLRAYGAGILSSSGELVHAVKSTEPNRIALDLLRCMRTRYNIDSYQQTYFVIDSFEQLFDMTAPDFTPLYAQLKDMPDLMA